MRIVTGIFEPENVVTAINHLTEEGLSHDQLSMVSSASEMPSYLEGEPEENAVAGSVVGAATGGAIGVLGAWIAPNIPGFESMIASGLLTTAAGSVIGAYLGGIYSIRADSQTTIDVHEELEAGSVLLVVRSDEDGTTAIKSILEQANGRDVEVHELED